MKKWVIACTLAATMAMSAISFAGGLNVGDSAPALKVAKWAKGTPFTNFKPGQVYVVEFWATWCGPCKVSIPHISELAAKYGKKVNFVGVSIWETEPGKSDTTYMAKVEQFVKDMGEKMAYNVAIDGPEGTMAETWMKAAGENGIPSAFVIDQKGKVAWIGHPMEKMDKVIDEVLAGTWNPTAYADNRAKMAAAQEAMNKAMKEISQLVMAGNVAGAVAKIDDLFAENPDAERGMFMYRFNIQLKEDEAAAQAYFGKLADGIFKDDANALNSMAWTIVDDEVKIKNRNVDLALKMSDKSNAMTKYEIAMYLDTLAMCWFRKDNLDKAIEFQTKAVEALKDDKSVPADIVKDIKDRLEMFKKKKAGGN